MQDRVDFEKDWNLFEIDTAEKLMNYLASQKPKDEHQISIMVERALQFFKKFNPEKVIETNFGSAFNQYYRFQQTTNEVPQYYKKFFSKYLEESKGMGLIPMTIALQNVGINKLNDIQRENILNYFENRHNIEVSLKNNKRVSSSDKLSQLQMLNDLYGDSKEFRAAIQEEDILYLYNDYLRSSAETLEKGKFEAVLA